MKKTAQFARGILASAVALCTLMAAVRAGAETVPQVIQVLKVEGNAQYTTDAKNWQPLHKGDILQQGSVIRTAEKSLVDVIFTDKDSSASTKQVSLPAYPSATASSGGAGGGGGGGSNKPEAASANVVRIFESTVLGVDKLMVDRNGVDETAETELDLRAGQIMGNVKKLSGTSHYEIKVPNGVAGIRGTGYLVSSSGKVYVLDGAVTAVIIAPDGSTIKANIGPGQMFDPSTYDPAHPENPPVAVPIPPALYDQLKQQFATLPSVQRNAEQVMLQDHTIMWLSPVNGTVAR